MFHFGQYTNHLHRFQNQVIANQLKRQSDEVIRLRKRLEEKSEKESKLEHHQRDAKRHYTDLESRMKEELMMARIRDAENTQRVAELTQKISSLEYKVRKSLGLQLSKIKN
jgi:predicted transcriptional regulator